MHHKPSHQSVNFLGEKQKTHPKLQQKNSPYSTSILRSKNSTNSKETYPFCEASVHPSDVAELMNSPYYWVGEYHLPGKQREWLTLNLTMYIKVVSTANSASLYFTIAKMELFFFGQSATWAVFICKHLKRKTHAAGQIHRGWKNERCSVVAELAGHLRSVSNGHSGNIF